MEKMWAFKKTIGVALGLLVLVGSGVVVGLTVVRVQNEKATVGKPKAASSWPACVRTGEWACKNEGDCFNGDNPKRNVEQCCPKLGSGASFRECEWPARGWCTPDQCAAAEPDNSLGPNQKRGQCGLYYLNTPACTATPPPPSGGASYTATSPKGGEQVSSLTPTFTWTGSMPDNNNYQNICIGAWVDANNCDSLGCRNTGGGNSYTLSTPLAVNTTYGWTVYSAFSPGTGNIKNMSGGCQQFKTQAAAPPPECTSDSSCPADKRCENNKCVAVTCTATPPECKKYVVSNRACELQNLTDGTACKTSSGVAGTCSTGVCNPPATHFECVNKTCAVVAGSGENKNGCVAAGGTCCGSNSDCTAGQTCSTATVPNSCSTDTSEVNACWGNGGTNGRCYDCNGDGVVNILDFSCFAKKWRENI